MAIGRPAIPGSRACFMRPAATRRRRTTLQWVATIASTMHRKHADQSVHAPPTVPVKFVLEDPKALTGGDRREIDILASKGHSLLDEALEAGINIEHACGGVCACSTCHVHVTVGMEHLSEARDEELDRVELAPDLRRNSRLSCQCVIEGDGPIEVHVPAWNRNAVKETPH
jgi:ferredoxin